MAPLVEPRGERGRSFLPGELVGDRILVAPLRQGGDLVQEPLGPRDDPGSADRVVGGALLGPVVLGDHVRPVEGVVEAPPARVRGVERVAGVVDRDDELRAGDDGDLGVHIRCGDGERFPLRDEVACLLEVGAVRPGVPLLPPAFPVPAVEPRLVPAPGLEVPAVLGAELGDDAAEGFPDGVRVEPRTGRHLTAHQLVERSRDPETAGVDVLVFVHGISLGPGRGAKVPER